MKPAASSKARISVPEFINLPKDYRDLCCEVLLPRPLHSRKEYRGALALAETMAGHRLTKDQDDYLDAITTFIEAWEDAHEPRLPGASPQEVLQQLLEANTMTGADLARLLGVTPSMSSLLLSGKRQLPPAHIGILSQYFKIGPDALLPGTAASQA